MKIKGRLIRLEGSPHIYLVRGHYKRHIANPTVFHAIGAVLADIQNVKQEEFDKYKTSKPFTLKDIK